MKISYLVSRVALAASLVLPLVSIGIAARAAPLGSAQPFAPGSISGPANDGAPVFTADGRTLFFTRSAPAWSVILQSQRSGTVWSEPVIAPFSGHWNDGFPALSPDGSFIVYVSVRPVPHGKGGVAGLWRVARSGAGWGEPARLPATVNISRSVWRASIAADRSLYFIAFTGTTPRLFRSHYANGTYQKAEPLPFSTEKTRDVDPEIAPDQSFLVFSSSGRGTPDDTHEHLYITFKHAGAWGQITRLRYAGDDRSPSTDNEPRLARDGRTLYFASDRSVPVHFPRSQEAAKRDVARLNAWDNGNTNVWSMSLAPWLHPG